MSVVGRHGRQLTQVIPSNFARFIRITAKLTLNPCLYAFSRLVATERKSAVAPTTTLHLAKMRISNISNFLDELYIAVYTI